MKKLCSLLLAFFMIAAVLIIPAAAEDTDFVYDWAGILSDSEIDALTSAAQEITSAHNCGVYIVTLSDMRDYGFSNIEACAEAFFDEKGLGVGSDHTGIMLVLSMAERDYDIDAHGDFAHYTFTDYGKTTISDEFLDNFRNNDWYGGFFDYLSRCEKMLVLAEEGNPVDTTITERVSGRITPGGLICSVILSLLIAWLVCAWLKGRMKSAKLAVDADSYILPGSAQITNRSDRYTHSTRTRRKIEKSSSGGRSGGTSISSGGHSHSSGKF